MAQLETTGLWQWAAWGDADSSPSASSGVVTGGDLALNPNLREYLGIGGQHMRRGGIVAAEPSITTILSASTQGLVDYALRSAYPRGALTAMRVIGGADNWGMDYNNAYINTLGLSCSADGNAVLSVAWAAMIPGVGSGGAQAAETALSMEDWQWVVEFEDNEYGVREWGFELGNNVTLGRSMDTVAPGARRLPNYALLGVEDLTVTLATGRPIPLATTGAISDALPTDLAMTLTGINETDTCVVTLTDLALTNAGAPFVGANDQVLWPYEFKGNSQDGSLDWSWSGGGS